MRIQFQKHIEDNFPQFQKNRLGVAISGGVDSVVLAHLCLQLRIEISLLHCNFQLRGDASNGDQAFVKRLADQWEIPLITTEFNTKAYIEVHKTSTQVGARELRYNWFRKMAKLYSLDGVVTAHHADDNLETFLINLSRGTGVEGLLGIPEINDLYYRPLLPFDKENILEYAKANHLEWREDASNLDTKYLRNKFRHEVIPSLKEIQPKILSHFNTTVAYLKQSNGVIKTYIQNFKDLNWKKDSVINGFKISVEVLKNEVHSDLILFEILKEYGFTAWDDISGLLDAQSGKRVLSETHVFLKDRIYLFLYPKPENKKAFVVVHENERVVKISKTEELILINSDFKASDLKEGIYFDVNKLKFPLAVRKWKEGDYFYPDGMSGKKKVSKYFKDEKFSIPQKENTWLLCSEDKVVWIVNYRADRRFIVDESTTVRLKIVYKKTDNINI